MPVANGLPKTIANGHHQQSQDGNSKHFGWKLMPPIDPKEKLFRVNGICEKNPKLNVTNVHDPRDINKEPSDDINLAIPGFAEAYLDSDVFFESPSFKRQLVASPVSTPAPCDYSVPPPTSKKWLNFSQSPASMNSPLARPSPSVAVVPVNLPPPGLINPPMPVGLLNNGCNGSTPKSTCSTSCSTPSKTPDLNQRLVQFFGKSGKQLPSNFQSFNASSQFQQRNYQSPQTFVSEKAYQQCSSYSSLDNAALIQLPPPPPPPVIEKVVDEQARIDAEIKRIRQEKFTKCSDVVKMASTSLEVDFKMSTTRDLRRRMDAEMFKILDELWSLREEQKKREAQQKPVVPAQEIRRPESDDVRLAGLGFSFDNNLNSACTASGANIANVSTSGPSNETDNIFGMSYAERISSMPSFKKKKHIEPKQNVLSHGRRERERSQREDDRRRMKNRHDSWDRYSRRSNHRRHSRDSRERVTTIRDYKRHYRRNSRHDENRRHKRRSPSLDDKRRSPSLDDKRRSPSRDSSTHNISVNRRRASRSPRSVETARPTTPLSPPPPTSSSSEDESGVDELEFPASCVSSVAPGPSDAEEERLSSVSSDSEVDQVGEPTSDSSLSPPRIPAEDEELLPGKKAKTSSEKKAILDSLLKDSFNEIKDAASTTPESGSQISSPLPIPQDLHQVETASVASSNDEIVSVPPIVKKPKYIRELASLLEDIFVPQLKKIPEPKVFPRRSDAEEYRILSDFSPLSLSEEDCSFLSMAWMKNADYFKTFTPDGRTLPWIEPQLVKAVKELPGRVASDDLEFYYDDHELEGVVPHKTGCARTEGFYKVTKQRKRIMRRLEEQSGRTFISTHDEVTVRHKTQASKDERAMNRRLMTWIGDNTLLRVNQLKYRSKMIKFARSRIHGWGLYSLETIAPEEMIIEYVGEKIRPTIADEREKSYERRGMGSSYMFRIDGDAVIDATKQGNYGRFINHSCNPNCTARVLTVDGDKRIVIYSKRMIEKGEEITYDYKFAREDEASKIECLCGAKCCQKYLN